MGIFYNSTLSYNQGVTFASGGTVTEITQNGVVYRVHSFTTVGVSTLTVNRQLNRVEYLVVAGGGAAGGGFVGGGGGAGGLVTNISSNKISISQNSYNIIVGSGGTVSGITPFNGENSSIDIVGITTAIGGGKGAVNSVAPSTGGSGGGGRYANGNAASTYVLGADGISGQGNKGGNGIISYDQRNWYTGAGGGAGGVGQNGRFNNELYATGGSGLSFNIDGTSKTYSTGGRGCLRILANTSTRQGLSGSPNTGNGGGGSNDNLSGGTGGSGIVIVRYPIGVVGQ